jgi:hypothetical protein
MKTLAIVLFAVIAANAQAQTPQERVLLAAADSALALYSRGDVLTLGEMMTPDAMIMSIRGGDTTRLSRRTREQFLAPSQRKIVERGFDGRAMVSGPLGIVWLPYDLYIDGNWSHCGVDVFTFVSVGGKWRLANLAWTVEQPPACRKHPEGPPKQG